MPLHRHPRVTAAKDECLNLLKDLTRRVRAGEIESLAVVMVTRDGRALLQRTDIDRLDAMLGCLVRMQRDVLNAVDEVDVPEI